MLEGGARLLREEAATSKARPVWEERGKISGVHDIWGTIKEATGTPSALPQEQGVSCCKSGTSPEVPSRAEQGSTQETGTGPSRSPQREYHHIWSEDLVGEGRKENKRVLNRLRDRKKNALKIT